MNKKMYKSKKHWVVASTALAIALGSGAVASAEETAVATTADDTVTTVASEATTEVAATETASTEAVATEVVAEETVATEAVATETTVATEATVSDETTSEAVVTETVASETAETPAVAATEATTEATSETVEAATASEEATVETTAADAVLSRLNENVAAVVKEGMTEEQIINLTDLEVEALNNISFVTNNVVGTGARITYKNLKDIVDSFVAQDTRYAIPYFKADSIQNMPAMYTVDAQTMELEEIDIWDSWPVQDPVTGYVSNWNGYQLVIGMAGAPNKNSNHIYLLYNEYGNNDFANWRNAGPIFGYNALEDSQEWSGSATVNSDGTVQLFYTKNDTSDGKLNWQRLASVTLNLAVENGEVVLLGTENDKELFAGDGYHYQTYQQFEATFNDDVNKDGQADRVDNYTLRDPHVVVSNGERYLVFEANTGTENYQGEHQVFTWMNYGGDSAFNLNAFLNITNNSELYKLASYANGAIGILKLDDNEKDPTVAEVYTPLITGHMTTDEVERPSIVQMNGKYYLFMASRINKSVDAEGTALARAAVGDDVVMLGYVSDSLTGNYTPLNDSGVVLTASVPADWRTSTYSYQAVPFEGSTDKVLIIAYMTNRGGVAGEEYKSTWAPSFLVQLNEDGTTEVLPYMTNQGDWIWDETSNSLTHVGTNETARLPHEDFVVDFDSIGNYGYGLKPRYYNHNLDNANKPTTPSTPEDPAVPVAPETPKPVDGKAFNPVAKVAKAANKVAKAAKSATTLPNTGDQEMAHAGLAGIMATIMGFVGFSTYKRKH